MGDKQKGRFFIRFNRDGIAISPGHHLSYRDTNLPHASMKIHPQAEWYWYVSTHAYDKANGVLRVEVVDYYPADITGFENQSPRTTVYKLEFAAIRWEPLAEHLSSYRKATFAHLLTPGAPESSLPGIVQRTAEYNHVKNNREIRRSFSVPIQKAKFVTGGVLVTHRFDEHEVQLLIENGFILKEFELLKEYFARALGKRKFHINASVCIENGKVTTATASSPEISKIDERLLDSVKYLEAKSISHIAPPDVNRELFGADEMYDHDLDGDAQVSGFELMEILLRDANIRNKRQIQYLAGRLHQEGRKVLFTAHPQFGFVFRIPGTSYNHFVWELLNSNATYVWSHDAATIADALALKKLEFTLSTIRSKGRQAYRIEMTEDMGVSDLIFNVIRHDHISSGVIDSFPVWRAKLHEKLV